MRHFVVEEMVHLLGPQCPLEDSTRRASASSVDTAHPETPRPSPTLEAPVFLCYLPGLVGFLLLAMPQPGSEVRMLCLSHGS